MSGKHKYISGGAGRIRERKPERYTVQLPGMDALRPADLIRCRKPGCQWCGQRRGLNAHWKASHRD